MIMTSRLESVSAPLATEFRGENLERQRSAALKACEIAIAQAGLTEHEADAALDFLQSGIGDREELRRQIEALAAKYDEDYLTLIDKDDEVTRPEALRLFSKARAASALLFALSGDSEVLHEVVYEATASSDDPTQVVTAVREALR